MPSRRGEAMDAAPWALASADSSRVAVMPIARLSILRVIVSVIIIPVTTFVDLSLPGGASYYVDCLVFHPPVMEQRDLRASQERRGGRGVGVLEHERNPISPSVFAGAKYLR